MESASSSPNRQALTCCSVGLFYIAISAVMIHMNKWLMREDHFPFAIVLTSYHMLVSALLSLVLYKLMPSWYTAMSTVKVDMAFLLKFVPIGVAFGASLILSNEAYIYLNVAFIQMLKEMNIAMVFGLSVMVGLQRFTKTGSMLLLLVVGGGMMAVYGEIEFVMVGVLIQLLSQLFEVTKILVQNMLMASRGTRLDPLTMVMFMSPVCFGIIGTLGVYRHWNDFGTVMTHASAVWPTLLANGVVAFILNIAVAMQIWLFSGVGFLLASICKDIAIVTVSAVLFGEVITMMQLLGFTMAILGVCLYSIFRMHETLFVDDNIITGFTRVFNLIFPETRKDGLLDPVK